MIGRTKKIDDLGAIAKQEQTPKETESSKGSHYSGLRSIPESQLIYGRLTKTGAISVDSAFSTPPSPCELDDDTGGSLLSLRIETSFTRESSTPCGINSSAKSKNSESSSSSITGPSAFFRPSNRKSKTINPLTKPSLIEMLEAGKKPSALSVMLSMK